VLSDASVGSVGGDAGVDGDDGDDGVGRVDEGRIRLRGQAIRTVRLWVPPTAEQVTPSGDCGVLR
jgi:hypothetical protein